MEELRSTPYALPGTAVGDHRFVYEAFELDITDVARPGKVNDLVVYVADVMVPGMADNFIEQLKWRAYVLRNGGLVDNAELVQPMRWIRVGMQQT